MTHNLKKTQPAVVLHTKMLSGMMSFVMVDRQDLPRVPAQERTPLENMKIYIQAGGQLIKSGQHREAMEYFSDREKAKEFGISLEKGESILLYPPFKDRDEIDSAANRIARNSRFYPDNRNITLGSGFIIGSKDIRKIITFGATPIHQIQHESALVYMEEWIHVLQNENGRPVAGHTDHEVDVAAYMQQLSIPMTDAFLRRYDRGRQLYGAHGSDDSLDKSVALRRGTFVKIRRSDGAEENDWQITSFHPSSGDAVVANFRQGIYKEVSRQQLVKWNEYGVYPFVNATSVDELYKVLDQLQKIQGYETAYSSAQLKEMIAKVKSNHQQIEMIPRSGGLRIKVAQLLGIRTPHASSRTQLLHIADHH